MQGLIQRFPVVLIASALVLASACNEETVISGNTGIAGTCTHGQAQLAVYDGFIQNLCGCTEAPQTVFPPETLTCTLPQGTVVYFLYVATTLRHQIVSTPGSSQSFQPSPVSDPNGSNPLKVYAVTLKSTGNYTFEDLFEPALTGTIVAQ